MRSNEVKLTNNSSKVTRDSGRPNSEKFQDEFPNFYELYDFHYFPENEHSDKGYFL